MLKVYINAFALTLPPMDEPIRMTTTGFDIAVDWPLDILLRESSRDR